MLRANQLLILVTIIAGIFRFYRLEELTTFGGDQGVDYQSVARMIVAGRPSLLGPTTHVGVYLGPLYYYLLIPFFLIFNFDPIAVPFFFALVGTATVALMYLLARKFFDPTFSFLAALLYAVSPIILESSRAPSQPHLIPFLSALLLLSLVRVIEGKSGKRDWIAIGLVLGSAIQFHYLTFPMYLFTVIVVGGLYVFSDVGGRKRLSLFTIRSSLFAVLLLAPWFLFELRHRFFITSQIFSYLGQGDVSVSPTGLVDRFLGLSWFTADRLLGQESQVVTLALLFSIISGFFLKFRNKRVVLLVSYAFLNLVGLVLYTSPLSNHYISALYPTAILLVVIGISSILKRPYASITLSFLIFFNLMRNAPFRTEGYTMPTELNQRVIKEATQLIADDQPPKSYEIANILDGDTRAQPYRYLLTYVHGIPPMDVHEYPSATVLYVIGRKNEDTVLTNSVWEIWSFSPKMITKTWQLTGTIVLYRLERPIS